MASGVLTSIEKLQGRENYNTWQFAIKMFLEHEGLLKCIDGSEEDPTKLSRAKTSIVLSIDKVNYVHVQEANTAKEMWDKLKNTFDDSGWTRKVGLLRALINTNLDSCGSMESYVNDIVTTAHKLSSIGFKLSDEFVGAFLLAGLPEEYRPMIMAIESSGMALTGDSIKTKLLQEAKISARGNSSESAMFHHKFSAKQNTVHKHRNTHTNTHSKHVKCYNCGDYGHKSNECQKGSSSTKNFGKPNYDRGNKNRTSDRATPAFSAVFMSTKWSRDDWFVDSGASSHMCMHKSWFKNLRDSPKHEISTANNSKMKVCGVGDIELCVRSGNKTQCINVQNVLYIPDITANLLSVSCIVDQQNHVKFAENGCYIYDKFGVMIASAPRENNLYRLTDVSNVGFAASALAERKHDVNVWHRRFAHVNLSDLMKMRNGAVEGVVFSDSVPLSDCVSCSKGKQSRDPFKHVGSRAKGLLDIVHSDLCGPMENVSIGGARYALLLIDDYSRMTHIYFLKSKADVYDSFVTYKNMVENQLQRRIKIFRSDNGTEYCNSQFQLLFKKCGIIHQK